MKNRESKNTYNIREKTKWFLFHRAHAAHISIYKYVHRTQIYISLSKEMNIDINANDCSSPLKLEANKIAA